MKTLIIDEEGKQPVVIKYHINLLGEIEPKFPYWVDSVPSRLKYYNRVLREHVQDMNLNFNKDNKQ